MMGFSWMAGAFPAIAVWPGTPAPAASLAGRAVQHAVSTCGETADKAPAPHSFPIPGASFDDR